MTTLKDLAEVPIWVGWKLEPQEKGGRPTKIPHNPATWGRASSTDPATWGTRKAAEQCVTRNGADGIGTMFAEVQTGLILVGIDLDTCRDPNLGVLADWAREVVDRFKSYTEISPSNTGVKTFFLLKKADWEAAKKELNNSKKVWKKPDGSPIHPPAIELHLGPIYFTVTGQHTGVSEDLREVPIEDIYWLTRDAGPRFEGREGKKRRRGTKVAPNDDIVDALRVIPNDNSSWEDWNTIGMAIFAATDGNEAGRRLFDRWSSKSPKHAEDEVKARWEHFKRSPPTEMGPETLFKKVREHDSSWARPSEVDGFKRDARGGILLNDQHNVRHALSKLKVSLRHDTFSDRLFIEGPESEPERVLSDTTMRRLWFTIDEQFKFRPIKEFFWDVVTDLAQQNSFHPVRDYLGRCESNWDGIRRIDQWLVTYGGAANSEYARAVSRLILVAAVRRIREPGSKFDEMLVLESPQGLEKSSALEALAVDPDWFSDALPLNADDKKVIETLAGHWIIEAAELKGMRRGDIEHLKAFLSRRIDRARMSYGRLVTEQPRQCVIVGTTNSEHYLKDSTGNRRFLPVRVVKFDVAAVRRDRDQIWGEAAAAETTGESTRLDARLWAAAAGEQEEREIHDPWGAVIVDALEGLSGEGGKILSETVWRIVGLKPEHRTQEHNARLGEVMRTLGWSRKKLYMHTKSLWGYVKGSEKEREREISYTLRDDGLITLIYSEEMTKWAG